MIKTALRGLRGRLLLSLVFTSAVTLVVAAVITVGPLQSRLRDESAAALQEATEGMRSEFGTVLTKTKAKSTTKPDPEYEKHEEDRRANRVNKLTTPVF